MFEFIRSVYRTFVLIGFWVLLIACTIGGGIIGKGMGGYRSNGHPIIGGIVGLIIGFVLDILLCGFIATILNIDENLEIIRRNSSGGSSSGLNLSNVTPINKIDDNTESKKCKICNTRVSLDNSKCPKCGSSDFLYS